MDVCPIPFNTPHPLSPRLIPASAEWTYVGSDLDCTFEFGEVMDQTATPPAAAVILTVDDIVKTPTSVAWNDGTHCTFTYTEALLGPSVVSARYPAKHPDFRSNLGELVTPFDMAVAAP